MHQLDKLTHMHSISQKHDIFVVTKSAMFKIRATFLPPARSQETVLPCQPCNPSLPWEDHIVVIISHQNFQHLLSFAKLILSCSLRSVKVGDVTNVSAPAALSLSQSTPSGADGWESSFFYFADFQWHQCSVCDRCEKEWWEEKWSEWHLSPESNIVGEWSNPKNTQLGLLVGNDSWFNQSGSESGDIYLPRYGFRATYCLTLIPYLSATGALNKELGVDKLLKAPMAEGVTARQQLWLQNCHDSWPPPTHSLGPGPKKTFFCPLSLSMSIGDVLPAT